MKYLRYLTVVSCILLGSSAHADYACEPCDPCNATTPSDCCDRGFTAYIDALYWHVCSGSLSRGYYNGEESVDTSMDLDYDWGWRVGGNYRRDHWDFGFRYTAFSSKTTEDYYLGSEDDFPVDAFYHFKYRVFDMELGRSCCLCDGFVLRPFAGGKFAAITADLNNVNYDGQDVLMDYEGRGLYLGFSTRWDLCHFDSCGCNIPLAFVTRFSTGVMHSDFNQVGDLDLGSDRIKECLFTPVQELYLGLEMGFDGICDSKGFFQLGYEAQYWGWREYESEDAITHLGLGGLVLRFGARF